MGDFFLSSWTSGGRELSSPFQIVIPSRGIPCHLQRWDSQSLQQLNVATISWSKNSMAFNVHYCSSDLKLRTWIGTCFLYSKLKSTNNSESLAATMEEFYRQTKYLASNVDIGGDAWIPVSLMRKVTVLTLVHLICHPNSTTSFTRTENVWQFEELYLVKDH